MLGLIPIVGVLLLVVGMAYFTFEGFSFIAFEPIALTGSYYETEKIVSELPYYPMLAGTVILSGIALLTIGIVKV